MNPSSFQYQPINMQKPLSKAPTFLNSKNLDKSVPNLLPNKQFIYSQQILSSQS